MRKKNIKFLIGLVSFALIGIITVQLLWINNTISENERQFHARVYAMLQRVVQKTERNEVALMYRIRPRINRQFTQSSPGLSAAFIDSVFRNFNSRSIDELRRFSKNSPFSKEIDQFINQLDQMQQGFEGKITNKNERLQSVHQWLTFEAEVKRLPLKKRLQLSRIEDILMQEKANFNINTPMEYAVFDPNQQTAAIQSKGFQKNDPMPYSADIFPNDVISASPRLYVDFPEKNKFLLHSIQWLLLLSLLFTLIILVSFYLTVKTILQQKKISEVKNDFINNMTHELKTPIATISLATDAMAHNINESAKGFTGIIKQESERMHKHVEQILQMARIDRDEFKINTEEIDIGEFVKDVCENQIIRVNEKNGSLQLNLPENTIYVEADPDHFANVVYNLLDNALKYTKNEPYIEITIKEAGDNVYFTVKDNGIGMSREISKHVFDKFYRAGSGNVHNIKGFGLGLSYVKAVITRHRGDISVKSEPGKGSTFTIKLPVLKHFGTNLKPNLE